MAKILNLVFETGKRLFDGADFNKIVDAVNEVAASSGSQVVNTAIATVGDGSITAASIIGGLITRSGPTGAFTDTLAVATDIVAALGKFVAGETILLQIKNTTAFNETLAASTGTTITGNTIIPPNSVGSYLVTITSATAVNLRHISTVPLSVANPEVITALSTVGAGVITGAGIGGGVTARGGSQSNAAFTDTTDTAAAIIAGRTNVHIGDSWEWTYVNGTNAAATLANGTGVTVSGITVVPAGASVRYLATYNAAGTITIVAINLVPRGTVSGTFTANQTTAVPVADTNVTANSVFLYGLKTVGGTPAGKPYESAVTPGTGFSAKAFAGDTSVYNYLIIG